METVHSPYLTQKFLEQSDELDLYSHVKFGLLARKLKDRFTDPPFVLDLGCALKSSQRALTGRGIRMEYLGVDRESAFKPDIVLSVSAADQLQLPSNPDVILLLDVLEHLDGEIDEIRTTLAACARLLKQGGRIFVTVPQNYRLDQFKLPHLHYPEHKVRLTADEWEALLQEQFDVVQREGVGYLSTLPYLMMFFRNYREENALGEAFHWLRGRFFGWPAWKPIDECLTLALNQIPGAHLGANDVMFELAHKKGPAA